MSWSKVEDKSKKPLGWWCLKIMCELGWAIRKVVWPAKLYYSLLNSMENRYNINIYGRKYEE